MQEVCTWLVLIPLTTISKRSHRRRWLIVRCRVVLLFIRFGQTCAHVYILVAHDATIHPFPVQFTMRHPDYPLWSLIGLLAVTLPAAWHWKARNIATISLIGWLGVSNLVLLVNTSVWADNYADLAPIWCDISRYTCRRFPRAFLQADQKVAMCW